MGRDRVVGVGARRRDEVEARQRQRREAPRAVGLGLGRIVAVDLLGRRVEQRDPRSRLGRGGDVTRGPRLHVDDADLLADVLGEDLRDVVQVVEDRGHLPPPPAAEAQPWVDDVPARGPHAPRRRRLGRSRLRGPDLDAADLDRDGSACRHGRRGTARSRLRCRRRRRSGPRRREHSTDDRARLRRSRGGLVHVDDLLQRRPPGCGPHGRRLGRRAGRAVGAAARLCEACVLRCAGRRCGAEGGRGDECGLASRAAPRDGRARGAVRPAPPPAPRRPRDRRAAGRAVADAPGGRARARSPGRRLGARERRAPAAAQVRAQRVGAPEWRLGRGVPASPAASLHSAHSKPGQASPSRVPPSGARESTGPAAGRARKTRHACPRAPGAMPAPAGRAPARRRPARRSLPAARRTRAPTMAGGWRRRDAATTGRRPTVRLRASCRRRAPARAVRRGAHAPAEPPLGAAAPRGCASTTAPSPASPGGHASHAGPPAPRSARSSASDSSSSSSM